MSAESELSAILNHASGSAASLTRSAQAQVDCALTVIGEPVELPFIYPDPLPSRGLTDFDHPERKLSKTEAEAKERQEKSRLPKFPDIDLPSPPNIVGLTDPTHTSGGMRVRFDLDMPDVSLELNTDYSNYGNYGNAPTLNITPPDVDSDLKPPPPPEMTPPPPPSLQHFAELPNLRLEFSPADFSDIAVDLTFDKNLFDQTLDALSTSVFNGGQGIELPLKDLSRLANHAIDAVLPALTGRIAQQWGSRYQTGLGSVETDIQGGLDRAIQQEADRVRSALHDHSGWDLPGLTQQAMTAAIEQSIGSWTAQAQSQQTTDQWEQAQSLFEMSAALYEKLRRTIQDLKARELDMLLSAHQQAIQYAKQMTDALLTDFSVKNYKKYDLDFQKDEAKLRQEEERLKVQLLEQEVVFARLEAEKAKQEQDDLLVQQYQAEVKRLDTETRMLATQVATARVELELKSLPIEVYEAQIRAYHSTVQAHEAKVTALIAEISGNTAMVEAESAKVRAFEAQADAYLAKVSAARTVLQTEQQHNDLVLDEFKAQVRASLFPVEASTAEAKYQAAQYTIENKERLAEAKLALEKLRLDNEWRQEEQKGLFEAYKATREQALSLAEKKLQILKAVSAVHNDGAQVMAQMAGGAMSAANGIANVIFRE